MAAPLLALGAWGRRPAWLVSLALLPLIYWQWVAPVRDLTDAVGEPSVEEAYYDPLLAELERRAPDEPVPGAGAADPQPLGGQLRRRTLPARPRLAAPGRVGRLRPVPGRQPDRGLVPRLARRARRRVRRAVARDRSPTISPRTRSSSCDRGLPYLDEVWSNEDWELYRGRRPDADRAGADRARRERLQLDASDVGEVRRRRALVALLPGGEGSACVFERDEWTVVRLLGDGPVRVEAKLKPGGLADALTGDDGEICSDVE